METNQDSLDDLLWNKYEEIQKNFNDQLTYYQMMIKYFKDILIETDRHISALNVLMDDSNIKTFSKLNDIFRLFNIFVKLSLENHKKFINNNISYFEKYIIQHKQLVPIYTDFKLNKENYSIQYKKFNKIKEKFYESATMLEVKILENIQKKNENQSANSADVSNKLKKEAKDNMKKYQLCIEETNKKREECVSNQKNLIKFYFEFSKNNLEIYYNILNDFLSIEKGKIISFLNNSKFDKLHDKLENKNIENETKEFFNKIKSNEKIDERNVLTFKGYKPIIDFNNCSKDEDFQSCIEAINIFEKNYKDIFDEESLGKEKLKNNIREWLKKFFEFDERKISIDENVINDYYFKSLKLPYTHKSFLKIVTDLRTNTHFNRNKQLIDLLGKSYKIILEEARINKDYWTAKNCLILSQTFYYLDSDNKKIYSCEHIVNNSWLEEINFWIEFCDYMLNEELKKLISSFPELNLEDIKNNKSFSDSLNSKVGNIIFSQILTTINNIIFFTKNNMYAITLVETFKEKYIYFSQSNIEIIYQSISSDENVISNLIEEYNKNKKNLCDSKNNNDKCSNENIEKNNDKTKKEGCGENKEKINNKQNLENKDNKEV